MRFRYGCRGLFAALLLCLLAAWPAAAQETAEPRTTVSVESLSGLSAEERAQLLSRLSDGEARALLAEYLQASAQAGAGGPDMAARLEGEVSRFRDRFADSLASAPRVLDAPQLLYDRLSTGRSPWHPLLLLVFMGVIAGGGWAAELLFQRLFRSTKSRLLDQQPRDFLAHAGRTTILLLMDLAGLAVFVAVAAALFVLFYQGHEPSRLLITNLMVALLVFRGVLLFSRPLFWPRPGFAPLLPFPEQAGRIAHRHVVAAAAVGSFGYALCEVVFQLGLPDDPHALMRFAVGTVLLLILLRGVWRMRRPVAESLTATAGEQGGLAASLAGLWHLPLIAYFLAIYAVSVFNSFTQGAGNSFGGILSLVLLVGLFLSDRLLYSALFRLLPDDADPGGARHIFARACHILVLVIAVAGLAWIWKAPIFAFEEGSIGGRASSAVFDIVLTVFIGFLLWGVIKAAVARHLPPEPAEGEESRGDEGGGASTTRLGTILPVLMKVTQITIATMVVMVALSALGVNIGPLLAGAGVIGLAVGFGAQTLVRDLVSGMFFLIDDAFRKGEYVDVGAAKGTVERINMRSLVLRHHMGPLHTIPYGEIQSLSNFSRDWVIMKLEFRVGYNTDPNKVKKIFKKIGAEMLEDPLHGPDFLEPFKSQGVKAMEDSAMIVRGKFMAKPGKQFTIRKEIYNRVRQAFEENGIEFAHRRVTVELPEDVMLSPEQQKKVAEAAGAAVAAEEEAAGGGQGGDGKT